MIRMVHCLSDGTGLMILVNDLLEFYDRLVQGEELEVAQEPFLPSSDNIGFELECGNSYHTFDAVFRIMIFAYLLHCVNRNSN